MSNGQKLAIWSVALAATMALTATLFLWPFLSRVIWYRGVFQWDAKSNHSIPFYGKVVDQDGTPLSEVVVTLTLNVFNDQPMPTNPMGRMRQESLQAISGTDGKFMVYVKTFDVQTTGVQREGYRWIESDLKGERGEETNNEWHYNERIELGVLGGRQTYKSDPDSPTVYVMLRDGAPPVVRAKMSRGGAESDSTGARWIKNEPFWPAKTNPAGIRYEPPATQPATITAGHGNNDDGP